MENIYLFQALNYCEAYNMEIGLLINFGALKLEFKRVHKNKLIKKNPELLNKFIQKDNFIYM
jgi:hypothetical protein